MIPYIATPNSITAVLSTPVTIDSSHPNFQTVLTLLTEGYSDTDHLEELMRPQLAFNRIIGNENSNFTVDKYGNLVCTVDGYPFTLPDTLKREVLRIHAAGGNLLPLYNFVVKLAANPDHDVRSQLYGFISVCGLAITSSGNFLAYKRIRNDYKDIYTGTMDNSPGKVLSMPRHAVEKNPDRTCSAGLHFAAWGYLQHYGASPENRIVILEVDPADVVSIPSDYNNMKGRAWRYKVVKELDCPEELKTRPVWDFDDDDADEDYEHDDNCDCEDCCEPETLEELVDEFQDYINQLLQDADVRARVTISNV